MDKLNKLVKELEDRLDEMEKDNDDNIERVGDHVDKLEIWVASIEARLEMIVAKLGRIESIVKANN